MLLLHNFGEIKDIDFLQDLFEGFVREHIYLVLVKDLHGKTMLENGGNLVLKRILRYHEIEDLNDLLRGAIPMDSFGPYEEYPRWVVQRRRGTIQGKLE